MYQKKDDAQLLKPDKEQIEKKEEDDALKPRDNESNKKQEDHKKTEEEKEKLFEKLQIITDRFTIVKRLGGGGFGEVFLAKDSKTGSLVAIKTERTDVLHPQLPIEKDVFTIMSSTVNCPVMHHFGTHGEFTVLVMELLGPSLEDLLNFCGRRFTPKTLCMVIEQGLRGLEALHNRSIIHRDLKPENFLLGLGKKAHVVHLIDFGLCKNYRHPLTFDHIAFRTGKTLTGTARYCSLYTHHGMEQSRRDDLECLCYIIIYLAKGQLPWMSIKISNRRKRNEKLAEVKESLTPSDLCAGLPPEFELFFKYCRTLSYTQRPDYGYLRNLLVSVIYRLKEQFDYFYDWYSVAKMFKNNLDAGKPILPKKKPTTQMSSTPNVTPKA